MVGYSFCVELFHFLSCNGFKRRIRNPTRTRNRNRSLRPKAEALVVPPDASALQGGFAAAAEVLYENSS